MYQESALLSKSAVFYVGNSLANWNKIKLSVFAGVTKAQQTPPTIKLSKGANKNSSADSFPIISNVVSLAPQQGNVPLARLLDYKQLKVIIGQTARL